jgi:hypothetical protein
MGFSNNNSATPNCHIHFWSRKWHKTYRFGTIVRLILYFGSISRNSFRSSGSNKMALGRMAQTDRHYRLASFVALAPGRSRLSEGPGWAASWLCPHACCLTVFFHTLQPSALCRGNSSSTPCAGIAQQQCECFASFPLLDQSAASPTLAEGSMVRWTNARDELVGNQHGNWKICLQL